MVQSRAKTVDAYLAEQDDDRRPALERMRGACREMLTGWAEGMAYGMPGY